MPIAPQLRFRYIIPRGKLSGITFLFYDENPKHKALKSLTEISRTFDQFMLNPESIPIEGQMGYAVPIRHDLEPMFQRGFISGIHQLLLQIEEDMHPQPEQVAFRGFQHTQGVVEAYDWAVKEEPDCATVQKEVADREQRFIATLAKGASFPNGSSRAFAQGYIDALHEIAHVMCQS